MVRRGWGLFKRVDDRHAFVLLPVAHVFRPQRRAPKTARAGEDHGVPKGKLPAGLEPNRLQHVIHIRPVNWPGGELTDDRRGRFRRHRHGDLAGDVHVKLLQYLDAETAGALLPQCLQQRSRPVVLCPRRCVVGVDEDIGIDKLRGISAHGVRRGRW